VSRRNPSACSNETRFATASDAACFASDLPHFVAVSQDPAPLRELRKNLALLSTSLKASKRPKPGAREPIEKGARKIGDKYVKSRAYVVKGIAQ
jgi:hypothetical protein